PRVAGAAGRPPARGAAIAAARPTRRRGDDRPAARRGQEVRAPRECPRLAAPAGPARLMDAALGDAGRAARPAAARYTRLARHVPRRGRLQPALRRRLSRGGPLRDPPPPAPSRLRGRSYGMGQEFCDAAWRRSLTQLGRRGAALDSLPYAARYGTLREAGLLPLYYRALQDEVAERAGTLRD